MNKFKKLKEVYLSAIDEMLAGQNEKAAKDKEYGYEDEYIAEQIKMNITDIFKQMFNLAYRNVEEETDIPAFKKIFEEYQDKANRLYHAYLHFFERIPAAWKVKAKKDKEFGKIDEYRKEKIKLAQVDEIKELFIEKFEQVIGGV